MAEYRPLIRKNGVTRELAAGDTVGGRYDVAFFATGKPASGEVVLDFVSPIAFTLPAALAGSVALAGTPPSAPVAFSLTKNGSQVGTVNFGTDGAATFAAAAAISVAKNDRLRLVAPSPQDGALSDVTFTLAGAR